MSIQRRAFLAATSVLAVSHAGHPRCLAKEAGAARQEVQVDLPRGRVPLSFIIDDSTCLVNMGKFCTPQFAATYPERADYQLDWRSWPDEIPDDFVREFGEWCGEQGVKGKYSIVPYPACVGWLDRTLPGWSQKELESSLALVRDLMLSNWDIHPEMITHTRVIDLKTGRPKQDFSPASMENSYPQQDVSVDHLAEYLAYALRVLKNCDLPCEGITTPGGFGNQVKDKLPQAVYESVRDVYGAEIPHYFKYVRSGEESTEPEVERFGQDATQFTMNVPAGTGDWFGGWTGVRESEGWKYSNQEGTSGRMVELIRQRKPAVMLCHWPGMFCGGAKVGFREFQDVVLALQQRFGDETLWMKVSEMARYWAAKEKTSINSMPRQVDFDAPFSCEVFTLTLPKQHERVAYAAGAISQSLRPVGTLKELDAGTFYQAAESTTCCFDLKKGRSVLSFE